MHLAFFSAMKRKRVAVNEQGRRIGEGHPRAKLTDADVDLIHELAAAGLSCRVIASKFDDIKGGISWETVRDILRGRRRGQTAAHWKPAGA